MDIFFQQLVNGLVLGAIYALVALGYTMVYGILAFINFAHSDVFMLGAFFAFYAARGLGGVGPVAAVLIALAIAMLGCGLIGFVIERLAYRPLRQSPKLTVLITAIGVSLLLENGGQLLFGAVPLPCGGATATNTDTVVVTGTPGTAERLTIDQSESLFGPGVEVESTTPEIEVVANLGDASDRLVVVGTAGDDKLSAGVNGVAIDGDNDVDVTFAPSPPPSLRIRPTSRATSRASPPPTGRGPAAPSA